MHTSIRERYQQRVSENQVIVDTMVGKKCLGYNIQYMFSNDQLNVLHNLQDKIGYREAASLYRIPIHSLHISVAWILATRLPYNRPKDLIWKEIGDECFSKLESIARQQSRFSVTFTTTVATDSAVIMLGEDNGEMKELREKIYAQLPIPQETINNASVIHTTLFRYHSPLNNPELFLHDLSDIHLNFSVIIDSVSIRKELIYPSIESELILSTQFR